MAARAGMANLILQVRALCNAGLTDYTVASVTYFTDDQFQNELDAYMQIWHLQQLNPTPEYLSGTTIYKQYTIPDYIGPWLEEDGAGSGGWAVKDGSGNVKTIVTDYAINYRAGLITFVVDQKSARNWLDCRSYDLYRAAAQIWRQKAGLEMRSIDWQSNGVVIHASQRRDYCLKMAAEMEKKAGIQTGAMYRSDEVHHMDGFGTRSSIWSSDEPL